MSGALAWSDAVAAAQLFAVDPIGTGGILLRSRAGPVRDHWLAGLRAGLPPSAPLKSMPVHIADGRLFGGLDLNATLLAGRPVADRGLLAEADGGVLVLAMAERLSAAAIVHLAAAMDGQETRVERDGFSLRMPARFGVVALDEGLDDEMAAGALRERLACHVDLEAISCRDIADFPNGSTVLLAARQRLASLWPGREQVEGICAAAAALGITSLRAPLQALRVARASAALAGHAEIERGDVELAARLVLAPRARTFPKGAEPPAPESPPEPSSTAEPSESDGSDMERTLDEVVLAAIAAALPPDVLASLRASSPRSRVRTPGKAGAMQQSGKRGRPAGVRRGDPRAGTRLNVMETLRAAAPWQALRKREAVPVTAPTPARMVIRKDDFRIMRFKQRSEAVTIFVVDASGSAALHRLAEAKGAVELLLADCYVRRDQVALISFRGDAAELLLPPTRSLARAKRSLAGLPGGGGTPLAAGLDAAFALADLVRRKGQTPTVILLTDGRANVARDGAQGRPPAEHDAMSAARQVRASGIAAVLIDTSPRPGPSGAQLALEMGARYLPLPHADAAALSRAVRATSV